MQLKKLLCLVLATLLLCLSGCVEVPVVSEPSETNKKEEPEAKEISILFIGTSFTYYNDMPTEIFKEMAEEAGYDVKVFAITKGGHNLIKFADPNSEYGAKVEAVLDGKRKYDYVILQEQGLRPASAEVPQFYAVVRTLAARIGKAGATPILYSTWGYKTGHSQLKECGGTTESMTWKLAAAYRAIGFELGIDVAYAGLAFYNVHTQYSMPELYNEDLFHPSYAGSYLAAATLFAAIFDEDPTTLTFTGKLEERYAEVLLEAARVATLETPEIPREYKTSSVGIGG